MKERNRKKEKWKGRRKEIRRKKRRKKKKVVFFVSKMYLQYQIVKTVSTCRNHCIILQSF